MSEGASQQAEATIDPVDNYRSFLISSAAKVEFCLDLADTRGVSTIGKIIPIPGTVKSIVGLTYFRGGIEAAVDLRQIWEASLDEVEKITHAVLVEAEGRRAVLLVDSLIDLYNCNPVEASSQYATSSFIGQDGEIKFNGRTIPIISAGLLLKSIDKIN